MSNEFDFIRKLKRKIPRNMQGRLGIGDDADLLRIMPGFDQVVSADLVAEGVDFVRGKLAPRLAGRKALAVNLSDMAAMGAKPLAFVAALGIPKSVGEKWLFAFYDGMIRLAKEHGVLCLGGDISRSRQFFAAVTILGSVRQGAAVPRSGAKPGDAVGVTGTLGGSILKHHYRFTPRVREALFMIRHVRVHAMIDISDGLWQDLEHVLGASGVTASVDLARIPVSADALKMCGGDRGRALKGALTDGEDFELLFTVGQKDKSRLQKIWPAKFPGVKLSWIGEVEKGKGPVLWCFNGKKTKAPAVRTKGFSHF
jgi:thiamine-monophosphate kinase